MQGGAFTGNTPVIDVANDCDLTALGCEEDLNNAVP